MDKNNKNILHLNSPNLCYSAIKDNGILSNQQLFYNKLTNYCKKHIYCSTYYCFKMPSVGTRYSLYLRRESNSDLKFRKLLT